ncbi:MAG: hypothetical protein ACXAC8_17545 [Candidatus Hodarchaeales archaeon]|jgi:alpha-aminoadipic semialdehyde synthase
MKNTIGIRLEDKNKWEKRVPIVPDDMKDLILNENLEFIVQPSPIRAFTDQEYQAIGANVTSDFSEANVIFAIKEIPLAELMAHKTYIFFSHTIKGQIHNMSMLKRILELKCTLIDYEKVVNEKGIRLIFFGNWAGLAGMIEILWGFSQRIKVLKNIDTPLLKLKHAWQYDNIEVVKKIITNIGKEITEKGLPDELVPLIVGFAGYGNVSRGAQSILDLLPVKEIDPLVLKTFFNKGDFSPHHIYKVVFKEEHMVEPLENKFELQDYYDHGKTKYHGVFEQYFPYLSILVNAIYWSDKYPRLIRKSFLLEKFQSKEDIRLAIIGDISCDIEGGIEATLMTTKPDQPVFIYNPITETASVGVEGEGMAIMAIDNLPCELPIESSTNFSETLKPFIPLIAKADYSKPFSELDLPPVIKNAVITHQGELTSNYKYIKEFETFKKAI